METIRCSIPFVLVHGKETFGYGHDIGRREEIRRSSSKVMLVIHYVLVGIIVGVHSGALCVTSLSLSLRRRRRPTGIGWEWTKGGRTGNYLT